MGRGICILRGYSSCLHELRPLHLQHLFHICLGYSRVSACGKALLMSSVVHNSEQSFCSLQVSLMKSARIVDNYSQGKLDSQSFFLVQDYEVRSKVLDGQTL